MFGSMSSSQYLVIASPSDDVFEVIEENTPSLSRGDIRSEAYFPGTIEENENSSYRNPARRHTHSGLSSLNNLLNRNSTSFDPESAVLSTEPYSPRIVSRSQSNHGEQTPVVVETVDESQTPAPDEKTRWRVFPRGWQTDAWAGRTAEVGEHALRALLIDVLPWVAGCYVIFYAFRNGGLGLGFTVFLLLVSAHGVLKWWTARGDDKAEQDDRAESEQEPSTPTVCTNSHHHHSTNSPHHHHHHHHHGSDSNTEDDYTTSDDSDLDDIFERPVVVVDEPPPSYDAASNPTPQDLCLGLEVHLKPREPRVEVDLSDLDSNRFSDKFLLANFVDHRRSSALSTSSYVSTELDDEFLPSYSEAVKKTRRKKSRRSSRSKGFTRSSSDNCSYDALVCSEPNASKMRDVCITITPNKDQVPSDVVVPSVEQHSIGRMSSSSHSSLDSVPGSSVSGSPSNPHRLFTTDCNSLLMSDPVFTFNADAAS